MTSASSGFVALVEATYFYFGITEFDERNRWLKKLWREFLAGTGTYAVKALPYGGHGVFPGTACKISAACLWHAVDQGGALESVALKLKGAKSNCDNVGPSPAVVVANELQTFQTTVDIDVFDRQIVGQAFGAYAYELAGSLFQQAYSIHCPKGVSPMADFAWIFTFEIFRMRRERNVYSAGHGPSSFRIRRDMVVAEISDWENRHP